MSDSMYSDLLLLRDLNFFSSLDPNQSNLSLASDQSPDECPLTEVIDDCLSCLFGKWAWHGPEDCDVDCPQVAVNASDGHLNTCLIEVPLQDTLQNQTVRVTDYCIDSILTHTYTRVFVLVAIIRLYVVSMYGVPSLWIWKLYRIPMFPKLWTRNNFRSTCKFPHYTTLPHYTGRLQYHSNIEQCEVTQNIVAHGSRGKG